MPDVAAAVGRLRDAGVPLMAVPDNYYVDLAARLDVTPELVASLREHGLLYDRIGDGELLHAYTPVLRTGFYMASSSAAVGTTGTARPTRWCGWRRRTRSPRRWSAADRVGFVPAASGRR